MTTDLEQRLQALELVVLRQGAPAKPQKRKTKGHPDIAPASVPVPDISPRLQVVSGAMTPLNAVLRDCKATPKSVEGIAPLCELNDVMERAKVKPNIGVKAENVKRAWATLVHFRVTDDDGLDLEQVREDLNDFKSWARDPLFIRALNLDPQLAICWFIDVLLATNGDLED